MGLRPFVCWIAGSKPVGGMGVCLLLVLSVVRQRSVSQADHSSRGVLQIVVCPGGNDCEISIRGGRGPITGRRATEKNN